MLYYMREKSKKHPLNWQQLEHAIKRNFGGLESEELNPFKVFLQHITMSREPPNLANISEEVCSNCLAHSIYIHTLYKITLT